MSIASKSFQYITQHGDLQQKSYFNFLQSFVLFQSLAQNEDPCGQYNGMWHLTTRKYHRVPASLQNKKLGHNYYNHNGTHNAKGIAKFQLLIEVVEHIIF